MVLREMRDSVECEAKIHCIAQQPTTGSNHMSHDIDESTGAPAMAYVGAEPWHGLGEKLPEGQTIEEWVRAARLDWQIQMLPVFVGLHGSVIPMRATKSLGGFYLLPTDCGTLQIFD